MNQKTSLNGKKQTLITLKSHKSCQLFFRTSNTLLESSKEGRNSKWVIEMWVLINQKPRESFMLALSILLMLLLIENWTLNGWALFYDCGPAITFYVSLFWGLIWNVYNLLQLDPIWDLCVDTIAYAEWEEWKVERSLESSFVGTRARESLIKVRQSTNFYCALMLYLQEKKRILEQQRSHILERLLENALIAMNKHNQIRMVEDEEENFKCPLIPWVFSSGRLFSFHSQHLIESDPDTIEMAKHAENNARIVADQQECRDSLIAKRRFWFVFLKA